jgi:holo-[acyl-carrier protein] synthase
MIAGVGTDLCDIARIAEVWQRQGERFARRILGDAELAVFEARLAQAPDRGMRYLATRFAAKEAFAKAVGTGISGLMHWRACQILNDAAGRPEVHLDAALDAWCAARRLRFHVSLSDEISTALAFVVAERDAAP